MTIFGPYRARVVEVHDGDTVTLDIDLGFAVQIAGKSFKNNTNLSCRIFGINAPELSTPQGIQARDFARTLLPQGELVTVLSHSWDKYGGRFDGQIILPDERDFGETMVSAGFAEVVQP